MNGDNASEGNIMEMGSSPALLVLGMHRSGTSAITGALRLCGAWTGEESELTEANTENPKGFWERRDVRQICDRLLHSVGADWWKIATFDPAAIPHAVLAEQNREFGRIVARLAEHPPWVLKEPRLCLLLPVLRGHITDPVCIHIVRNPLEVARSLQTRNGFGIAAGLALWEAYNRHALGASANLPRVLVSHESLMLHSVETLDGLVKRLDELAVSTLVMPDADRLERFINPSLYRRRATEEETEKYLSPSQRALWRQLCSDHKFAHDGSVSVSRVTKQHLFDLESAEISLNHHKDRARDLGAALRKRAAAIEARDATIRDLTSRTEELNAALGKRVATIEVRDATIRDLTSQTEELNAALGKQVATIEARDATIVARDATIRGLTRRTEELNAALAKRVATIVARDAAIHGLLESTSWKITAPLRSLSRGVRWLWRNFRRALKLLFWLSTGQFSRAVMASLPYYRRYVPRYIHERIPRKLREFAAWHVIYPDKSVLTKSRPPQATATPPTSTYIVPSAWWERNPDAARSLAQSGQAVIVMGCSSVATGANITAVAGVQVRTLALAAIATETAIEIAIDAEPAATAWTKWSKAVENREARGDRGVCLLTSSELRRELACAVARETP